ncbi:flagellar basal body L-ring protein FlgH [Paracoccus sp. S-4012]|uniref:flagellar basal body L-ring protein FlgH n=1 Tax=Paracoccus sp. S-4012 TaxID=2665648 RepID=UPI0012B00423|nr:flagellar basal body L-ring protein FlgH [Paracoccus sp. S-4012]MRX49243.1 flagellar basal body L-ring protein FlgH [Paracoccus sp. S-4012]
MSRATPLRLTLAGVVALAALGGCARLGDVGQTPAMTAPTSGPEFEAMANPVLFIPDAPPTPDTGASLWDASPRSLVRDHRASVQGDIVTVVIEIDDRAEMQNTSGRTRRAADSVGIEAFAGIPQRLDPHLPAGASLGELAEASASSTFKGSGNISRRDKLTLRVAATVIETLPNGVLHIQGTQEVRVNYELRELTVSGFVRPQDIDRRNEVAYDRIAGARIAYGGRGQITDVQQPRYGQQVADILLPW